MKVLTVGSLFLLVALTTGVWGAALDENFGYVDVRPGAHMFWVAYHTELPGDWTEHPLILWLQGGPGASGVGYGNFEELGPYDINGNLRDGRWTKKANLMFVDNPVGSGYSYVDDLSLLTTNNTQIADDLLAVVTSVFTDYPEMQVMPFFVYAESYGGKMTVDFALALDKAITNGDIVCNFQGVALGDSWISPMDSVNTWGPFLYQMGFVNAEGQASIDASAARTQTAVDNENWSMATNQWSATETVVLIQTGGVNFYNVLAEEDIYDSQLSSSKKKFTFMSPAIQRLYDHYVRPQPLDALTDFMDGPQAAAWGIPPEVSWGSQSGDVFNTLSEDFMKPVISSVEELLTNSKIHVSVYTGDLDLICDTPGTYRWIENMNYPQKSGFDAANRKPLHVTAYSSNAAYVQRFERFSVFTILRSGHMVPIDAPEMCLNMIDMITGYGAETVVPKKVEVLHHLKAKVAKHQEAKAAKHPEIKIVKHTEDKNVQHPEAKVAKHPEAKVAKHPETKNVKHPEAKVAKHPEAKVAKHPEAKVAKHPEAKVIKHEEPKKETKVEEVMAKQHERKVHSEAKPMAKIVKPNPKMAAKVKISPEEKEMKAKIAHSHLSKATPNGHEYNRGNIFNPQGPAIGIH